MAVVLLLPLVPVMHTHPVRRRLPAATGPGRPRPGCRAPPARRTSSRYRLMPGDLTTTSQCCQGGQAAVGGGEHRAARHAAARRPVVHQHRLARPAISASATLGLPSTPRPQRRRGAPRRSDQEIFGRIGIRDEVLAERQSSSRRRAQLGQAASSPASCLEQLVAARSGRCAAAAPRPGTRRPRRRTRTACCRARCPAGRGTCPPARSVPGPGRPAARGRRRSASRSAGGHERRQDQVDEAALVAAAAPVIEAARRVDVERAVTAAERAVVLGEPRRTAGPPTAR